MTVHVRDWGGVREAYRRRELRQAMYDEGALVMADALLNLHGPAHRDRRRLENRLFRRETFVRWERDLLGATLAESLAPVVAAGRGDLLVIGYRTTMNLTATIAGVDRTPGDVEQTESLLDIVRTLSEGATIVHSTRDKDAVRAEVAQALERFDWDLLAPSVQRRRALMARDEELPADVLSTLLANADELGLDDDAIRREVAFYLQAGSHSTANAFTHTLDELFRAATRDPGLLERAASDPWFAQRCVHETLRLHPASPVAWRRATQDCSLGPDVDVAAGELVVIELAEANRDPHVWGPDAERWDPDRTCPVGVPAWGNSFGGGVHACIGAELDGGLEQPRDLQGTPDAADHLFGTVATMVVELLRAGARPDPEHPPVWDTSTARHHFSSYPVLFGAAP